MKNRKVLLLFLVMVLFGLIAFVMCSQSTDPQEAGVHVYTQSAKVEADIQMEFAVPIDLLVSDIINARKLGRDYLYFKVKKDYRLWLVPAEGKSDIDAFPPPPGGP